MGTQIRIMVKALKTLNHQTREVKKAVPAVKGLGIEQASLAARVLQAKVELVRALRDLHDAHLKHELAVSNEVTTFLSDD